MRELNEMETAQVAGAGFLADLQAIVNDPNFADNVRETLTDTYEALVDVTSHVIGRVAGDLHTSYYE